MLHGLPIRCGSEKLRRAMITLTINGQKVTASPEKTILQVCREQKIDNIPTLCYDDKLPPFGSCFLCVVELEGQNRLFPSCATKVTEGMIVKTRSERVVRARKTCLELLLSDHYADCFGPCRLNCPADVDIQGYMSLIQLGKFKEAVALIKEKNPLPSVCGRVCTRKCEINCRRTLVDEAVGIDFLKRYVADQDMIGEMWKPEMKDDNGDRIAIIGGGPAGLTCAYYLVTEGYRPTIFESLPALGGMLRYGIPEYRLPKEVLDKEINWITDLGVEVQLNRSLGKDFTIDDLFKQGYKSVFIGLGAQVGKPMQVDNEDVEGVLTGVDFLRQVEMNTNPPVKGRVVVVGGGNTAIDAARTSLRLGADEVILLYRRTRNEMPANMVEIEAAEHEGVKMEFLAAPVRVNVENDRMASIECLRMELGEPDSSGRRKPVPQKGSEYTLTCDWVISAIGQEADLTGVEKIKVTKWKTIDAKAGTFDVDRPGVFAGGDVVTGPADAIDAIAAGRLAARAIQKYITTGIVEPLVPRFESKRDNFHKLTVTDLPQIEKAERHTPEELFAADRVKTFNEVELPYDDQTAREEALRCAECGCDLGLNCSLQDYCTEYGVDQKRFVGAFNRYKVDSRHPFIKIDSNKCIRCGKCVNTCSEILNVSALGFVNRGFRTIIKPALEKALQDTNCVSCGNCIDVCPTGALVEKMPFRRSGPWKMDSYYNVCNYCSVGCNITFKVKTPDLFFVTGASPETGPNNGELCVRGRFGYEQYLDGSRQLRPMVRKGGKLVRATWEEAFDAIQAGIKRILDEHGNDAVMISASPKLTNEELYLAGRLARRGLKTNNLASFHRLVNEGDYHALDNVLGGTFSTVGMDDVLNADLYLVLGSNPTAENPVLGWKINRRMRHGAKAIVINSAQIDLAKYASVWADPRRGTSTMLVNGIISELIRHGKIDTEFINSKTNNFAQIKEKFSKYDIPEIATITGVSPESIEKIVDVLSVPNQKIVAIYNLENRADRAVNDLQSLASLMLVLGKIGVKGSGLALLSGQCNTVGAQLAGFDDQLLPGGVTTSDTEALKEIAKIWNTDIQKLFAGGSGNIKRKIREDKIRLAIILGENPMVAQEFNSFINNLEFTVVADMFLTETAQAADVFLPLSAYLENEGHLTNWSGARQKTYPIGEPMSGLSTIEIISKLSDAIGSPMKENAGKITEELDSLISRFSFTARLNGKFPTSDGKANFALYSEQIVPSTPVVPGVLAIDARMQSRLKSIKS
jgi:formate dehydrogenase major subunit